MPPLRRSPKVIGDEEGEGKAQVENRLGVVGSIPMEALSTEDLFSQVDPS